MKLSLCILVPISLMFSCVTSGQQNSIIEITGVNQAVVYLTEPSSTGEKIHFLRTDCKNQTSKSRKCVDVPIAEGTITEALGAGKFKVQLDPGGRIEAFATVRKHKIGEPY